MTSEKKIIIDAITRMLSTLDIDYLRLISKALQKIVERRKKNKSLLE